MGLDTRKSGSVWHGFDPLHRGWRGSVWHGRCLSQRNKCGWARCGPLNIMFRVAHVLQGFRREAGKDPGTASSGGEKRGAEAAGLAGGRQRSSGPGGSGLRRRGEEEERYGAPQYLGNEEEDGRQWQKPTYSQRGQGFGKGEVTEELKTI